MSSLSIGTSVPVFTKNELDNAPKASWLSPDEVRAQIRSQLETQGHTVSESYIDYAINEPFRSNSVNNTGGSLLSPSEWKFKNETDKKELPTQSKQRQITNLSSMLLESLSSKLPLDIKNIKRSDSEIPLSINKINNSAISAYLNNTGD